MEILIANNDTIYPIYKNTVFVFFLKKRLTVNYYHKDQCELLKDGNTDLNTVIFTLKCNKKT